MSDIHLTSVIRLLQAGDAIKARLAGEFSAVHGLSVNEMFLLMQLEQASRHRLPRVELARRLYMSASTVTRMAAPLEKLGLVGRQADSRDARLAYVVLSESGLRKVAEVRETFAEVSEQVFRDRWAAGDVDQLSDLLGRLVTDAPGSLT